MYKFAVIACLALANQIASAAITGLDCHGLARMGKLYKGFCEDATAIMAREIGSSADPADVLSYQFWTLKETGTVINVDDVQLDSHDQMLFDKLSTENNGAKMQWTLKACVKIGEYKGTLDDGFAKATDKIRAENSEDPQVQKWVDEVDYIDVSCPIYNFVCMTTSYCNNLRSAIMKPERPLI